MKSAITTHVLDVAEGKPAAGVYATLEVRSQQDGWLPVGVGTTDSDGRISNFLSADAAFIRGTYRIRFDTGAYHAVSGRRSFHPSVVIVFDVDNVDEHYHVPLLLSPFGYTTYRGS